MCMHMLYSLYEKQMYITGAQGAVYEKKNTVLYCQ